MHTLIENAAALVTRRPRASLLALALVTLLLAAGNALVTEQADSSVFLPPDSEVAIADEVLDGTFPDSAGLENVTVLHRGDVFTVDGLTHIDDVVERLTAEQAVTERLALTDPVASVSALVAAVAGSPDVSAMSQLDIPYNVVTALITALSIGIGVDYTIHIIHRFTEELEHRDDLTEATHATLLTTGSALVGSALTTALGFAVLLFSPLVPFQQFGLVTAITILFALVAAIAVVPPMLIVWAAYHQWRRGMTASISEVRSDASARPVPSPA